MQPLEATTGKLSGMRLTFHFGMSAESLSISITDPYGEPVLIDHGYLHIAKMWKRNYAHAEIGCETKTGRLCPCVVFMENARQLPKESPIGVFSRFLQQGVV
jgi:hypothetical protein